jgi:hypothetical protein
MIDLKSIKAVQYIAARIFLVQARVGVDHKSIGRWEACLDHARQVTGFPACPCVVFSLEICQSTNLPRWFDGIPWCGHEPFSSVEGS